MRKHTNYITAAIFTLITTLTFSQVNDTINTGVIDIVKPYAPTISDAFKVKETPTLDDQTTETKKAVQYNIFSVPVASTFTPAKGKAATVEKAKPIKLYDNYATLGLGSYTTILGEVYLNHALNRSENIGGYVSHHSSQGDIEGVSFDDGFSDSKLKVNYTNRSRYLTWNLDGGFRYQTYNWYGVPESQVTVAKTNNIDVGHAFYDAHVGGDISFDDTYIKSGSLVLRHFGDNQGSGENRITAKATVDVPINREEISTEIKIDYLGGGFDGRTAAIDYANFNIGLSPTYQLKHDYLTLDLGLSFFYLNDMEFNKNKFYVYPNIKASYKLVDETLIAYGGITGNLIQNTYRNFASENNFVSPTLFITPTDQIYNAFVGLKGKITSNVGYNIGGSYTADKNKAMYRANVIHNYPYQTDYDYGNSFGIVYDDVKTFGLMGEIQVDLNRNFILGLKGEYFSYNTDTEAEAWNLPDFKGNLLMDYQITEQWFAGANLYYIGKRKDILELEGTAVPTTFTPTTLKAYFDANAHVGYHVNDRLSVFAKANNIANEAYQRWQNFPVQSIQFLAGATYKFDF
ncbi:MAG: TonB-dependent receptor [Flavobacteriaceae bacterium]